MKGVFNINITGIDLEALAEAQAYLDLAWQVAITLCVLLAVYAWAKWEGALE